MTYKPKTHGEFSGGPGMIQPEQVGHESEVQDQWLVKATQSERSDSLGQPLPENVGRLRNVEPVNAEDLPQTVAEGGVL